MAELNTLGATIKETYEGEADTNAFTDAEQSKLAGIQDEATKNASDEYLLDRTNATGVQLAASIADLPDLLDQRVAVEEGKGLSSEDFTPDLRQKLEGLEDPNFKGVFMGVQALENAYPTGEDGEYASVDDGETVQWYAWSDGAWVARVGESTELTPAQVAQYYESVPGRNQFDNEYKAQLDDLKNRATWRRLGTWNAATNTPTLTDGEGRNFDYYIVTTAGKRSFGNFEYPFQQYDIVLYQGGTWIRWPLRDALRTINGKSPENGAINLTAEDIGARPDEWTPTWEDIREKPELSDDVALPQEIIGRSINAALVRRSSNLPFPTGAKPVPMQTVVYDVFGGWSGSQFTIPNGFDFVRLSFSLGASMTSDGNNLWVHIRKNGVLFCTAVNKAAGPGGGLTSGLTPIEPVVAGDVISFNANVSQDSTIRSEVDRTWVQVELFRRLND